MADDLDLEAFRERVDGGKPNHATNGGFNLAQIKETCRWVSKKDGSYCFQRKDKPDGAGVLATFDQRLSLAMLKDRFAWNGSDEFFCPFHATAINFPLFPAIKLEDNGASRKELVQWVDFGAPENDEITVTPFWKTIEAGDPNIERYGEDKSRGDGLLVAHNVTKRESPVTPTASSTGTPASERAQRFEKTKDRDLTYNMPAEFNDRLIVKKLCEDLTLRELKSTKHRKVPNGTPEAGFVYAFRDPEIQLVKIGRTSLAISTRIGQIKTACNIQTTLFPIASVESTLGYRRVESLLLTYFQPHRVYHRCGCKHRHIEWFDVPDVAVINAFTLWQKFIQENPYGALGPIERPYPLTDGWRHRFHDCLPSVVLESTRDHEKKLDRWQRCMFEASKTHTVSKIAPTATKTTSNPFLALNGNAALQAPVPDNVPPSSLFSKRSNFSSESPSTTLIKQEPRLFSPSPGYLQTPDPADHKRSQSVPSRARPSSTLNGTTIRPSSSRRVTMKLPPPEFGRRDYRDDSTFESPMPAARQHVDTAATGSKNLFSLGFTTPAPKVPVEAAPPAFKVVFKQPETPVPREEQPAEDTAAADSHPPSLKPTHPDWEERSQQLLSSIKEILLTKREGLGKLPPRSIADDLVTVRWPLAFVFSFGLFLPYVPRLLGLVMWTVVFPLFVAELRIWFPEKAVRS